MHLQINFAVAETVHIVNCQIVNFFIKIIESFHAKLV